MPDETEKTRREALLARYPEITLLDKNDLKSLKAYLLKNNWIQADETVVSAVSAGEGNMNYTLRVFVSSAGKIELPSSRSFILKQSRPWVEKYDHIPAPWDRIIQEARFYQIVAAAPAVASRMPGLLGLDPVSRVAVFEDLGVAEDFSALYREKHLTPSELGLLTDWLCKLHSLSFNDSEKQSLSNRDMRVLNHEHIFRFPLRKNNGLDLNAITPGLNDLAIELQSERPFVKAVETLGRQYYLKDGPVLLHGDYFPGSWLGTRQGIRIIDPEFAFFGPPEFDAGVMLAHLILAQQPQALILQFLKSYTTPFPFRPMGMLQLAGVEIMRRILGVAQLPIKCNFVQKQKLLATARQLVLDPQTWMSNNV